MNLLNVSKYSALHQKISAGLIMLIVFFLLFSIKLCSICIILFVLHWIYEGNFREKFSSWKSNKLIWLFAGFYLMHFVWMLSTDNAHAGKFDLEKKLSLLLFPLVLGTSTISKKHVNLILSTFVLVCLLASVICLVYSYQGYLQTGDYKFFTLGYLTKGLEIHRVYFSLYLLQSICILFYFILSDYYKNLRIYYFLLIGYCSLFIMLAASRIVTIALLIIVVFFLIIYAKKTRQYLSTVLFFGAFSLITVTVVLTNENIRTVLKQSFQDLDKGNSEHNTTGPNLRVIIWRSALTVFKENLPMGAGTGDVDDLLVKEYIKRNFKAGITEKLNAHNQFLQTGIGLGLPGLAVLLVCFILPGVLAYKKNALLYIAFLLCFFLVCFTESMLCTQKGVVYYAFFNSFFAFHFIRK